MMSIEQKIETLEEAVRRAMKKGFSFFGLANHPSFLWRVSDSGGRLLVSYKLRASNGAWQYGSFSENDLFFSPDLSFWRWLMGDDEKTTDFVTNKFLLNKGRYDVLKGVLTRQDKYSK